MLPTAMKQAYLIHEAAPLMDEDVLIAKVLDGDRLAGRQLYSAHAPRIYRLVYRLAGNADLAQEWTQDTFIRAFRRLEDFRGEAAFGTWLHRIAVSVTLNGLRKVRRFQRHETSFDEAENIEIESNVDGGLGERVSREVDALPEILRTTLVMHDVEGYTHGEIADALGVPEGTCKTRLSAARARLRQALAALREA